MRRSGWVGAAAAALMFGCAQMDGVGLAQRLDLQAVRFDQMPGWQTDTLSRSFAGFRAECHRLALLPPDTRLGGMGLAADYGGQAAQWAAPCAASAALVVNDEAGIRHFYERWFQPYRLLAAGFFTGYYEPEVQGARSRGGGFTVALLARPANLIQAPPSSGDPGAPRPVGRMVHGKLIPFFTRAEIEAGALGTAAHPLLWLRSPADLFFLQVQGAGRVRLPDGSTVHVGYDGKNGRTYTPIGRVLIQQNEMAAQDVNMQSIKAWLAAHPAEAQSLMDRNDDYVFFKELNGDAQIGPPGALGVDLTPQRSAAVDPHYVPMGTPLFVDTTDPVSGAPWRHLVLAQDSGTDIKGPARADLFFGSGAQAEQAAGRMQQAGTAYILLPRPAQDRAA